MGRIQGEKLQLLKLVLIVEVLRTKFHLVGKGVNPEGRKDEMVDYDSKQAVELNKR